MYQNILEKIKIQTKNYQKLLKTLEIGSLQFAHLDYEHQYQ